MRSGSPVATIGRVQYVPHPLTSTTWAFADTLVRSWSCLGHVPGSPLTVPEVPSPRYDGVTCVASTP